MKASPPRQPRAPSSTRRPTAPTRSRSHAPARRLSPVGSRRGLSWRRSRAGLITTAVASPCRRSRRRVPRPERGASPEGFRQQVLSRLRNRATQEHTSAQRLQQRVAFERLLDRLGGGPVWVLKGGFALELRYGWSHRPTRDIDLRFGNEVGLDSLVDALRTAVAT